jgi:hypothetical protein
MRSKRDNKRHVYSTKVGNYYLDTGREIFRTIGLVYFIIS